MKSVSGRDSPGYSSDVAGLLRVSGSHHIYGKSGSARRLSVPIHGNNPLKTGLLRHLTKLAEIPDEDL